MSVNYELMSSDEAMSSEEGEFVVLDRTDVEDFNEDSLLPLSTEALRTVRAWLEPTDYLADSSEYCKHLNSHLPGTCDWIQESPNYREWYDGSEKGCLWIKAIAGAGKSVAAASLASRLASRGTTPVLFFFFRQIITANQRPRSLLRDYLSQLLTYSPPLQHKLKTWIDDGRPLESLSSGELLKALHSSLVAFPRVYCVADALDEMDEGHEDFLKDLVALGQIRPASIKVLLTSRPLPRIEEFLRDRSVLPIILQESLVEPDILIYIRHRLDSCDMSGHTRKSAQDTVHAKSKGLFLYARLVIDDILDPLNGYVKSDEDIRKALAKTPNTLNEMYARMLLEHSIRSGVQQDLQIKILRWVTRSERPLRVLELMNMINFSSGTFFSRDTKAVIKRGCGPLLEILEDETVCVIHHSLTEYLYDPGRRHNADVENAGFPLLDSSNTQRAIALMCITFLTTSGWHHDFEAPHLPTPSSRASIRSYFNKLRSAKQQTKLKYPFLSYAASNWYRHVAKLDSLDEEFVAALDHLMLSDAVFEAWLTFEHIKPDWKHSIDNEHNRLGPIHVAAWMGMTNYLVHLIKWREDVNGVGWNGRTPLFRAAEQGHEKAVEALLAHGADKDHDDDFGLKPLLVAAMTNRHKVISVLLRSGVDPFTPKTKGWPRERRGRFNTSTGKTAVELACRYGHVETMEALIPYLTVDGLHTALYWAARFGSSKVVKALLKFPKINVNRITRDQTPLSLAAGIPDIDSMRLLLGKGADPRILSSKLPSGKYRVADDMLRKLAKREFSPLQAFACSSSTSFLIPNDRDAVVASMQSVLRLLVDAGCDVNAVDATDNTALSFLVRSDISDQYQEEWQAAVRFLLESGASATEQLQDGSNLLHIYKGENPEIIRLLLSYGANVNSVRSSDGKTPLLASRNHLLLDHGADCNIADADGNTILHSIAQDYTVEEKALRKSIGAGADFTVPNLDGNTPLHLLIHCIDDELLKLCLDHGGNLESRNNQGHTVLLESLSCKESNLLDRKFQSLVEAGADLHAVDYEGRTVLHLLCSTRNQSLEGMTDAIKYMVGKGVNPQRSDHGGNTVFHEIAKSWLPSYNAEQVKIMDLLIDLGISPTARNNRGELPLHIASRVCPDSHGDVLTYFLSPKCQQNINAADVDGVRPIHIAATYSEELVERLLSHGADPTLLTKEGQTPLMVASRARQSNTVGLLVDSLQESRQGHFVHHVDRQGDSALHHACRAGRRESVKILLEAGADPNLKNGHLQSPLYACSDFPTENAFWETSESTIGAVVQPKSAFVLSNDEKRPHSRQRESRSTGVRGSIRMLIEYGADMSFLGLSELEHEPLVPESNTPDPLVNAIATGCEPMIDELLSVKKLLPASTNGKIYPQLETFSTQRLLQDGGHLQNMVKDTIKQGGIDLDAFSYLLKREQESAITELKHCGADLLKIDSLVNYVIKEIVRVGNVTLLNEFSSYAKAMNGDWVQTIEKASPNLVGKIQTLLHAACSRALPNFDVIETLVERYGANVNEIYTIKGHDHPEGGTPLHRFATGAHWWYQRAAEYLIKHGANLEAKTYCGATPLLAACNFSRTPRRTRLPIIRVLLRAGANPNAADDAGRTALELVASRDLDVIEELLKAGADPNQGRQLIIFGAIDTINLDLVRILLEHGADCNIQPVSLTTECQEKTSEEKKNYRQRLFHRHFDSPSGYPLEKAVSREPETDEERSKMASIVEALLAAGADPFMPSYGGDTVLQNIAAAGVFLEPFLKLPDLPLETRDTFGRTLLLAVCSDTVTRGLPAAKLAIKHLSLLLSRGASLRACDYTGRNALHLIIDDSKDWEETIETIQFIISQSGGASLISMPDSEGRTALHYALSRNVLDTVEELLKHGADIIQPDPVDGSTAFHHIAPHASKDWLDKRPLYFGSLLTQGVDINHRDDAGETPLFPFVASCGVAGRRFLPWCIPEGNRVLVSSIQIFVDAGADVTVRNKRGESLLHRLAEIGGTEDLGLGQRREDVQEATMELFSWLMERGCDVSWEDYEQRTALDVAAACGSVGILRLFKRE